MLRSVFQSLRHFLRREDGTVSVEAVLMFPILAWCYMATFVYFDGFRAQSTTLKAAYTVADALSRETDPITPNYLSALYRLHLFLTTSDAPTRLRVTEIVYNRYGEDDHDDNDHRGRFEVVWSQTKGNVTPMTTSTLKYFRDQIPTMPNGGKTIIVESWVDYSPIFNVGLDDFTFENFIVTPPRFASQLCWSTRNTGWTSASLTC